MCKRNEHHGFIFSVKIMNHLPNLSIEKLLIASQIWLNDLYCDINVKNGSNKNPEITQKNTLSIFIATNSFPRIYIFLQIFWNHNSISLMITELFCKSKDVNQILRYYSKVSRFQPAVMFLICSRLYNRDIINFESKTKQKKLLKTPLWLMAE